MVWEIIVFVVAVALAVTIGFKHGELAELHKTRAEFEHLLDTHPLLNDDAVFGIKLAENIIDDLLEDL